MARSKHSPALYEVIDRSSAVKKSATLKVPRWWRQDHHGSAEAPGAEDREKPATPSNQGGTVPYLKAVTHVDEPDTSGDGRAGGSVVRVEGGRVRFSMNMASTAMVVGGVVLAVLASYQLGATIHGNRSATAGGEQAGSLDAVLKSPVNPDALEVGPTPLVMTHKPSSPSKPVTPSKPAVTSKTPAGAAPAQQPAAGVSKNESPDKAERLSGLNYVILETFKATDYEEAVHAQTWLAESQKLATTLERQGDRLQLISAEGFDYTKPDGKDRCAKYCERVQALGKLYKKQFGAKARYTFLSPVPKKF